MNAAERLSLFDKADQSEVRNLPWSPKGIFAELKAVADNRKGMSMVLMSDDEAQGKERVQLIRKASDMGLLVSVHKARGRTQGSGRQPAEVRLFFVLPGESWRIPAYLSMKRAFRDYDWSDGAEFLEGLLLGYDEEQMTSWVSARSRRRIGWQGLTCYFVMSRTQRAATKRLANRCIDPSSITKDIEVFYCVDNLPLKESIRGLLPEGICLCRASIRASGVISESGFQ